MKKKKIMLIFGTRPEAIKLAPIVKELEKYKHKVKPIVVVTGQHRQMLDQILSFFNIEAHYDLNIMLPNQNLFDIARNSLKKFEPIFLKEKPDLVLVQGDTTTSFIATLSSYFLRIPVAHVEAGLRTYDKYSPFPEEINRRLISSIADVHFAPTKNACDNLIKEHVDRKKILITGNTVIDAVLATARQNFRSDDMEDKRLAHMLSSLDDGKKLILITAHRRESFGEPLKNICNAILYLATKYSNIQFVYPVHLNPNVQKTVLNILGKHQRILLTQPVSYAECVYLMKKSHFILTDSGGIQEEAPALGKPVLVMRNKTERQEAIKAGTAKLVYSDKKSIIKGAELLLRNKKVYNKMARAVNPYGDGNAAERIVQCLLGLPSKEFNPYV